MINRLTILFFSLVASGCTNTIEPEINLIPKGYVGKVILMTDEKNGQDKEYEGNHRLYRIGNDGTLLTKFKFIGGVQEDWKYYYVDSAGQRELLTVSMGDYSEDQEIQIIQSGSSSYADSDLGFENKIYYKYFIVDIPSNINNYQKMSEEEREKIKKLKK